MALLAGSRTGWNRDELTAAFWPAHDDHSARNRLHHTVHLTRKLLGAIAWPDDWVLLDQGRVRLDPRVDCDAWQVQDAACSVPLSELDSSVLFHALRLCQGEWAPDVNVAGLGQMLRHQFKKWHLSLQVEAARRLATDGDTPIRRESLERVLSLNDTDEWACHQLLELDHDAGRDHAVLRRFQSLSRALAATLGLRPSEGIRAIAAHSADRLNQNSLSNTPSGFITPLVGREPLLRALCAQLQAGGGLWNVSGLGGMGKTALMREVVRRVGPSLKDGVHFINGCEGRYDPITRALHYFGLAPVAPEVLAEALVAVMAQRDALIVFDDLDASAEMLSVLTLLPEVLRTRVVALSKLPLNSNRFAHVPVRPLNSLVSDASVDLIRQSPAVVLFNLRRPSPPLGPASDDETAETARLVQNLDGWPLAIELAAAKTDTMTIGELLEEVNSGRFLEASLSTGNSTTVKEPQPLRLALDSSFERLCQNSQRLYAAMGVFPGAFSGDDLESIASAIGTPATADTSASVVELLSSGLLIREDVDSSLRMPKLARLHARSLTQFAAIRCLAEEAFIQRLTTALWVGAVGHESPRYLEWMAEVFLLGDSASGSLHLARSLGDRALLGLLIPLVQSWSLRGAEIEEHAWFTAGAEAAVRQGDWRAEMILRVHATRLCLLRCNLKAALLWSRPLKDLADQCSGADGELGALAITAYLRPLHQKRPSGEHLALAKEWLLRLGGESMPGYHTVLAEIGRLQGEASVAGAGQVMELDALRARFSGSLVWVDHLLSAATREPPLRLKVAEEMLAASRTARSPALGFRGLMFKASALEALGRHQDFQHVLHTWFRLACARDDHFNAACALTWRAEFAWRMGSLAEATRHLNDAKRLFTKLKHPSLAITLQCHEVIVKLLRGELECGIQMFLSIGRQRIDTLIPEEAETVLEAAALLAKLTQEQSVFGTLLQVLGRFSSSVSHTSQAVQRFRQQHLEPPVPSIAPRRAPTPDASAERVESYRSAWPDVQAAILASMRSLQVRIQTNGSQSSDPHPPLFPLKPDHLCRAISARPSASLNPASAAQPLRADSETVRSSAAAAKVR